jgi:RNA polymerase sigma factor (sigma-70 family)
MAVNQISEVISHLRRAVLLRDGAGLTDGQLLEDYIRRHEEAALAALVHRHGPMVWGVCRRVLRNHHDAEDAFQATFLVLVRKAASVVPREMVANWLYGVAHQTALKARATTAKRRARERQVTEMPEPAVTEQDLWHDLQPLLDQELSRLPDKYRVAIVLCDLEGKTRKEAARQVGVPDGTLAARLARARAMLAKRLARHGLAVSGGTLAGVLLQSAASASVPTSVISSTIEAARLFAAGQAAAASVISVKVAALTEGVLKAMLLTKLKTVLTVLLAVSLIGTAASVFTYRTLAGEQKEATQQAGAKPAGKVADEPKTDKSDKDKLQGSWTAVSGEMGEKEVPEEAVKNCKFVFTGDKVVIIGLFRGEKEKGVEGTFKLAPTTKPKAIDITITNKEDALGIYDVEGDTLKICMVEATGNERPNEFAGKDKQILIVLKRAK